MSVAGLDDVGSFDEHNLPERFVVNRLPEDDDELWWLVRALWGYMIPRTRVCPEHQTPFDAFANAFFHRDPISMWLASRGLGGKSRTLALLGLSEAVLFGCEVSILGGTAAQSLNVHAATQAAWSHPMAPRHLLVREPTKFDTVLDNGGSLRSLMASQGSVRGPHPPRLRMDEIDVMDQEILDAALGQPLEQVNHRGEVVDIQTTMSSTHQVPDGVVTNMLRRSKEQDFPVFRWCVSGDSVVPVRNIGNGPETLTRAGWRRIQHVTLMGRKPTVIVTMTSGAEITCTGDHLIATPGGWVPAASLVTGELVCTHGTHERQVQVREYETQRVETLQQVLAGWQEGAARPDTAQALHGEAEEVPALPGASQEQTVHVVQEVLDDDRVAETKYTKQAESGYVKGDDGSECSPSAIEAGRARVGVLDGTRLQVHRAGTGGFVRSGLRSGGRDVRGSVRVAPREAEQEARQEEGGVPPQAIGADNPLVAFGTSVVAGVSPGPVIPVYDIGVEGVHEFVANGVVVHNCYKETSNPTDGWLTQKSINLQKSVIPARMWEVEFELQEPSFEGRAIDTEAVDRCFDPELGDMTGDSPWFGESSNGHYVTAVDWAKKRDKTIIATFDTKDTPWRCVAWQQVFRTPWPIMVSRAVDQWRRYGGRFIHDATGVGDVVDDIIKGMITSREESMLTGYIFSGGRDRQALFAEYASAIENDDIRYPRIRYAYDEHRYCSIDDLYGGGHPPDSIIAGALAWRTRTRQPVLVLPSGGSRAESPWF